MATKVWLLVEWVDENNMFASYGIVNVDTLAYDESDLRPGNTIFISVNQDNPKRAKILRISENKRYVKEHKEILERQDQQVKNVLQICMRTIKEMKSERSVKNLTPIKYNAEKSAGSIALPHILVASNVDSGSDSEPETNARPEPIMQSFNRSTSRFSNQHIRKEVKTLQVRGTPNTTQLPKIRRPLHSSTPLPTNRHQNATLVYDQGTQTEDAFLRPPLAKIEAMEAVLKNLYQRFQNLVAQANATSNGSSSMSESENNEEGSFIDQGNGEGNSVVGENMQDIGAEEVIEENGPSHMQSLNNSHIQLEDRSNPNAPKVRRMSAQTTNNVDSMQSHDADLVPIGNGNAKVPMRLLNEINWNSHTSATRQLLQAVFPRRVLATHCLTGKQSPAFMNRPPKKILDPKLVEDIVKIVSTRCGVPKNLVRNSITIKCTDEAKLYRNRQHKQKRKLTGQDENQPPSTPSSDESSNVVMN